MSEQPKLTPWFDDRVKPKRPGVYQTSLFFLGRDEGHPWYSRWTGKEWMDSAPTIDSAAAMSRQGAPRKFWRGLASKPKGGAA